MPSRFRRTSACIFFVVVMIGQVGCSYFSDWYNAPSYHREPSFTGVITDPHAMTGGIHSGIYNPSP